MTEIQNFKIHFYNLICVLFPEDKHVAASGHAIHYQWEYPKTAYSTFLSMNQLLNS